MKTKLHTSGAQIHLTLELWWGGLHPCLQPSMAAVSEQGPRTPSPPHLKTWAGAALTLKARLSTSSPPLFPSRFTTTCFPYCSFRSTMCLQQDSSAVTPCHQDASTRLPGERMWRELLAPWPERASPGKAQARNTRSTSDGLSMKPPLDLEQLTWVNRALHRRCADL